MNIKAYLLLILSVLIISTNLYSTEWIFVPEEPGNLKKGDVLLSKSNSPISAIINGLGYYWHHAMMVIDDYGNLRHNTVDGRITDNFAVIEKVIQHNKKKFYVRGAFDILLKSKTFTLPYQFDPIFLEKFWHNSFDTDPELKKLNLKSGIITTPKLKHSKNLTRLTISDESKRPFIENIADEMNKMEGFYMLNSYANMEAFEPTYNNAQRKYNKNGGHCSGTIWWANKRGGKNMNMYVIDDSEKIFFIANNMYSDLVDNFYQILKASIDQKAKPIRNEEVDKIFNTYTFNFKGIKIPQLELAFDLLSIHLTNYVVESFKKKIKKEVLTKRKVHVRFANQIMNTFLFNRSYDATDYWKQHYNEINIVSVAPDHLLQIGMPDPNGNFNGIQTPETSYYDAIENYSSTGGYWVKVGDEAPVDPRVQGEFPEIIVYSNELKSITNTEEYITDLEIIPLKEENGGILSKKMRFYIQNNAYATPLELIADSVVSLSNTDNFEIVTAPEGRLIEPRGRQKLEIKYTPPENVSGHFSTIVSIPNSDPEKSSYEFKLTVNVIKEAYFTDIPIYYNQCENDEDLYSPLIGDQYSPYQTKSSKGGYRLWTYTPVKFNNGYMVGDKSRNKKDYCYADIYPFNVDKEDISVGTCTFWSATKGGWRGKGINTHIEGELKFMLTNDTYVRILASNKQNTNIMLYANGKNITPSTYKITRGSLAQYVVQWDFKNHFADGTNLKLYCNGNLVAKYKADVTPQTVNDYKQYIRIGGRNTRTGDYRPDYAYAKLDNVIIWNKIVELSEVMSIGE